jgi:membrane associated rhomboid family serine protease
VSFGTAAGPPEGAPAGVPTCYRHPDRETYVRCTRCDRPICPDCMVDAAVGFQCPECVREANAGSRTVRTPGGGALTSSAGVVTRVLIGVMVAIYVVQLTVGDAMIRDFASRGIDIADGEYYRMITAGFLHGSITHLLFNMFALYLLGTPLEAWFGRLRFGVIYALSLIGGSVASYVWSGPFQYAVGASGAIFGLMGATYAVALKQRWDVRPVTVLIGINLVLGFVVPNIDWRAHLGGLVVGLLVALPLAYAPRERRTPVLVATTVATLAVLGAVTAYRTAELEPLVRLYFGT